MNLENTIFVLGADDPEMEEIKKVLTAHGLNYHLATSQGVRVNARTAYEADDLMLMVDGDQPLISIVGIECKPKVDTKRSWDLYIDHHNPGDHGFGKIPSLYTLGSSLGQLLRLLNQKPTKEQKLIMAADHCLSAAYAGLCPGVEPDELLAWRLKSRAKFQNRSVADLRRDVQNTRAVLETWDQWVSAPGLDERYIYDLRSVVLPELPEVQAQMGLDVLTQTTGRDGVTKLNAMGAKMWCKYFLENLELFNCENGYGSPTRGIVGAYLKVSQTCH